MRLRPARGLVALGVVVGVVVGTGPAALAAPAVTLSKTSGPPKTVLTVGGSGFPASSLIDLYWDTTDVALAATDRNGTFSGITIQVPASAAPGTHWVTASGRPGGPAAQKGFLVRTNWTQFKFSNGRRGTNPYENVISPANVADLELAWHGVTDPIVEGGPVVANGIAYIASDDGHLYAFSTTTHNLLWKDSTGGGQIRSVPAVSGNAIYVGTGLGLYAFPATCAAASCSKLWSFPGPSMATSSPLVVNGVIYVGSFDDNLYAISASTHAVLWHGQTGGAITASPAYGDGAVFVGSQDGNLYAFPATASCADPCPPVWATTGAPLDEISGAPAVAGGRLWQANDTGVLTISNTSCWCVVSGGFFLHTSDVETPAVASGIAYIGSVAPGGTPTVWAVSAGLPTGTVRWRSENLSVDSAPAVANGVVYVADYTNGNIEAFAASGCGAATCGPLWIASAGTGSYDSPVVADGVLYAAGSKGIYAFDLNSAGLAPKPQARPDPAMLVPDRSLPLPQP